MEDIQAIWAIQAIQDVYNNCMIDWLIDTSNQITGSPWPYKRNAQGNCLILYSYYPDMGTKPWENHESAKILGQSLREKSCKEGKYIRTKNSVS